MIKTERINEFSKSTIIEYGEVFHSTLLKIFGNELTYNELKFYARDKDATTYLTVETLTSSNPKDKQLITVWFYSEKVLERKYSLYHSCEMFIFLSELESELEQEEEEEDNESELERDEEGEDNEDGV